MQQSLIDPFQRPISYLRVSVTDRCDLRCAYCMSEKMTFLPKKDLLTLEELNKICTTFIKLGVKKIRITGGEPLIRKNIITLFETLSQHLKSGNLAELTLTTNATKLHQFAEPLAQAGVKRINISLDTLNPEKFTALTKFGKLQTVLNGIKTAQNHGIKLKINTVALKGFNEDEILSLVKWCATNNLDLTFIEVMPMGDIGNETRLAQYLPLSEVRDKIAQKYTLIETDERSGGPARYVRLQESGQKIGFITPLTHNFCENCNRVRLTCTGQLYMCLGQEDRADLRDILRKHAHTAETAPQEEALEAAIREAISRKPKGHDFNYAPRTIKGQMPRHMSHTGG